MAEHNRNQWTIPPFLQYLYASVGGGWWMLVNRNQLIVGAARVESPRRLLGNSQQPSQLGQPVPHFLDFLYFRCIFFGGLDKLHPPLPIWPRGDSKDHSSQQGNGSKTPVTESDRQGVPSPLLRRLTLSNFHAISISLLYVKRLVTFETFDQRVEPK